MCPVSCPSMCLPVKQRDRSSGHKWDAKRGDTRWEKQAINVMGDMTYQQIANSLMYQRLTDWLLIPNLDEDSCVVSRIIQLFFSLEVCIPSSKHVCISLSLFLCRDSCSRIPRVHYSPWQENCTNFVSLHWSLSLHKQRKKSVILWCREKEKEGCTLRVKVDLCLAWLSCLWSFFDFIPREKGSQSLHQCLVTASVSQMLSWELWLWDVNASPHTFG